MMKLTSSLTDFNFDIIEGINGKDVPKKALSGVSMIDFSDVMTKRAHILH